MQAGFIARSDSLVTSAVSVTLTKWALCKEPVGALETRRLVGRTKRNRTGQTSQSASANTTTRTMVAPTTGRIVLKPRN